MFKILVTGVNGVKNGFKWVDLIWGQFNQTRDKLLVFLSRKYIPQTITPNRLSWLRILLAAGILPMLFNFELWKNWLIGFFIVSLITDVLDGPLARARQLESEKGAFLDRVGDKLLICPLVASRLWFYDPLIVLAIVGSEIISISLAISAMKRGVSIRSNWFAKWKMVGQATSIIILLFLPGQFPLAAKILWLALGLNIASLISHFQSYISSRF